MKPTQGKWEVWGGGLNVQTIENHNFIASCGCNGRPIEENRANARLIASAPELLEALKDLIGFHKSHMLIKNLPEKCAVARAEQAISKAEVSE